MKIADVTLFELAGRWDPPAFPPGDRQANALDIYPEFNAQDWTRQPARAEIKAIYVEVQAEAGPIGRYGPIEIEQAFLINGFLRPFLRGRDALASELLHDQMLRLHRHGRSGMFMTAVSAIDCALWDLKGQAWGQPVYRLLGGPTRPAVPAYASLLGYAVEPEAAAIVAQDFQAQGYPAQKWFFRYGPADGPAGMERNLALIQAVRAAVGPHYPLMVDAFMGWDATYAAELARALEQYRLHWLEEPIPPERVGAFVRLKAAARVALATGEHVYTRWQVKELLVAGAVDFIQADPDWAGGISELVKICALASAFEVQVVAHGHALLPALHIAGAQSPAVVPWVEYLVRHQEHKQFFHQRIYRPIDGQIPLPDLPGLGLVLDEAKIHHRNRLFE